MAEANFDIWTQRADLLAGKAMVPVGRATWMGPGRVLSGTVAELVAFIASQPESDRLNYTIVGDGIEPIGSEQAAKLRGRGDFPA